MPSHSPLPDWRPTVQANIKNLIDDVQCYQTVRELRWPEGVACPSCESQHVIKRGFDDAEPTRQRYECHDCDTRFGFLAAFGDMTLWNIWCSFAVILHISTDPLIYRPTPD